MRSMVSFDFGQRGEGQVTLWAQILQGDLASSTVNSLVQLAALGTIPERLNRDGINL